MRYSKLVLLFTVCCLTGCSSITFTRSGFVPQPYDMRHEKWHHVLFLNLYEYSEPINIRKECRGAGWSSVKTEVTPANFFATIAGNLLGPIWYPQTVEITCSHYRS